MDQLSKLAIILAIAFFIVHPIEAQENEIKKNYIYGSVGSIIFQHQGSLSFERMIYTDDLMQMNIKANIGWLSDNHLDLDTDEKVLRNHKSISAVILLEVFEANLGLALTQYTLARGFAPRPGVDYNEVLGGKKIYYSFGLRHKGDTLVLRAGFSNLELLYVGIGFKF